jgi:cAMP-dependent protein kinase regulator
MDLHAFLSTNPHTAMLSPPDCAALARQLVEGAFEDGHVFIKEGQRGDALYLLLEGEVVVTRSGLAEPLKSLQPGELFGLIALIDNEPRSAGCRAVGPVRVAALPHDAFSQLFNAHAPIADALQRALAAQLTSDFRNVNRHIRDALSRAPTASSG